MDSALQLTYTYITVLGDFNAKFGGVVVGEKFVGRYGLGKRSEGEGDWQ